jgi:uroporphyrin-III C-methyltransferase/precorrin-2 dehydrogenase/sirohydrochlorin ferrochelatase
MSNLFPALPVFMDLIGRAVVILAGDRHGAELARNCLQAGAGVSIIHPDPGPDAQGLVGVKLIRRSWRAADFRNAALVAAGCDERRMTRARASAKAAKAIFMALDRGPGADVTVGETAAIGPFTIGVAGAGLPSPLLALLRKRLETAVPPALGAFLDAAAQAPDPGIYGAAAHAKWADALAAALDAIEGRTRLPDDWAHFVAARINAPPAARK